MLTAVAALVAVLSEAAPVTALVVPDAGHALDLHRNAHLAFTAADRRVNHTTTGRTSARAPVTTCRS